jgi:putative ABC transport system permease protein
LKLGPIPTIQSIERIWILNDPFLRMIWKLAIKNLLRNKRRTAITLVAIILGLTLLNIGLGMMDGLQHQSERNLIDYSLGHLKLFPPNYNPEEPPDLKYTIAHYEWVADSLDRMPIVKAALGQIIFEAGLSNGLDYLPVRGIGFNPNVAEHATLLKDTIVDGKFLDAAPGDAVLGVNLAQTLDLQVGSTVTLDTRTVDGMRDAVDINIIGLLRTGNPLVDRMSVYIPINDAQRLLNLPDQVTEILVRLDLGISPDAASYKLAGWVSSAGLALKVVPWEKLAQDFISLHRLKKSGMGIIMGLLVLLTAVGIANTILMATFERSAEIGMMRAMGMSSGKVRLLFLYEGIMLGFGGGIIAVALGGSINLYLESHGINLTAMYGNADIGYPIKDVLYSEFNISGCLSVLTLGIVMSAIASIYPAWRAGSQPVVNAFRQVK